jgi:hypothetical protein
VDSFRNPKVTECVEGAFHLQDRTRCIGTFSLALRNSHCNFLRCGRIRLRAATNLTQAKSPLIGRPPSANGGTGTGIVQTVTF